MADEFWIAGCLVLVIEGLILAAMPASWQRLMLELATIDPQKLRTGGIVTMIVGLVGLKLVKG